MAYVFSLAFLVIISVNGFNTPAKRQIFEKWLKISYPITYYLQEPYFIFYDTSIT